MLSSADVIQRLQLQPHPVEGGYFRETQRTKGILHAFGSERSIGTAIYYLLTAETVSEMHLLPGDEIFHYYLGDPLETLLLHPDGSSRTHVLGNDLIAGQFPQLVVPGGVWQGSHRLAGLHGYTLIGATMAPGFDYRDYTTGARAELTAKWPDCGDLIKKLTPKG
ncbi:MAG: cupin domain-containing protein [Fimbriiglobus sp.]